MTFSGWPEEALDFYDELAADNTKTYWTANKAVYEEKILRPMADLTEELAAEFGEPKIFRPYRDVRFSPDKTPYKTHIGAVIGGSGLRASRTHGQCVGGGNHSMTTGATEFAPDRGAATGRWSSRAGPSPPRDDRAERHPAPLSSQKPRRPEDPAEPASVAGSLPARCADEPAIAEREIHRAGWLTVLLAGDDIGSSRVLAEQNLLFQL